MDSLSLNLDVNIYSTGKSIALGVRMMLLLKVFATMSNM
ncbi:mannose-1-P guanylyltransferase domain protein [Yersinia pestis PY-66]|nr:mannose-1-P guanylyltransferase domain protein [Yersinia pestis PY-66]